MVVCLGGWLHWRITMVAVHGVHAYCTGLADTVLYHLLSYHAACNTAHSLQLLWVKLRPYCIVQNHSPCNKESFHIYSGKNQGGVKQFWKPYLFNNSSYPKSEYTYIHVFRRAHCAPFINWRHASFFTLPAYLFAGLQNSRRQVHTLLLSSHYKLPGWKMAEPV